MGLSISNEERNVIPRWRKFSLASKTGELNSISIGENTKLIKSDFNETIENWELHKTLLSASDLINSAIIHKKLPDHLDAVEFILKNESVSKNYKKFVANILEGEKDHEFDTNIVTNKKNNISKLKKLVSQYPYSSLIWLDLAREYTILGQINKAERAVASVYSLSKFNRFILRSLARFYIHINRPDKSLYILNKSHQVTNDPWLMASEIATNTLMDKSSKFLKKGKNLIDDNNFSSFDVSELTTAIGTHEIEFGTFAKGKKLLRKALNQPSENSLAQLLWINDYRNLNIIDYEKKIIFPKLSFEAKARNYFEVSDFERAFSESFNWLEDQPFSVQPTLFSSSLSSVIFENYEDSIKILNGGLVSNKNHSGLLNDLAFAYARNNQPEMALEAFNKINESDGDEFIKHIRFATYGLINFRQANLEAGRLYYNIAIDFFIKKNRYDSAIIAALYLLHEEILNRTIEISSAYERVKDYLKKWYSSLAYNKNVVSKIIDVSNKKNPSYNFTLDKQILKQ